jgi:hypothetical protein
VIIYNFMVGYLKFSTEAALLPGAVSSVFLCFYKLSHVCPEPVLANHRCFYPYKELCTQQLVNKGLLLNTAGIIQQFTNILASLVVAYTMPKIGAKANPFLAPFSFEARCFVKTRSGQT